MQPQGVPWPGVASRSLSPDVAAAGTDGCDDRVPLVPEGEVAAHAAPVLEAHAHGHGGRQGAPRHRAGDAGVCAPAEDAGLFSRNPPLSLPSDQHPVTWGTWPGVQACSPGPHLIQKSCFHIPTAAPLLGLSAPPWMPCLLFDLPHPTSSKKLPRNPLLAPSPVRALHPQP